MTMRSSQNYIRADDRHLGQRLKALRLAAGLTQNDIARHLGVSYQQVQKYESGHSRLPLPMLVRLKRFYDLPYDSFLEAMGPAESDRDQGHERGREQDHPRDRERKRDRNDRESAPHALQATLSDPVALRVGQMVSRQDAVLKQKIEKVVSILTQ